MKKCFFGCLIVLTMVMVSCSDSKTTANDTDNEVTDQAGDSDVVVDDETTDSDVVVDGDTSVDESITDSKSDDDVVGVDEDATTDGDVIPVCAAPADMTGYRKKPYARARIYLNESEIEVPDEEECDSDACDSDIEEYPDGDIAGVDMHIETEYNTVSWHSGNYDITSIVIPGFDEGESDLLLIEAFETDPENEDDVRWLTFHMDAEQLRKMKTDGVNKKALGADAVLVISRNTETETMTKSCFEAVLKSGEVYACHDSLTNYNMYDPLNLWFTFDLETDEAAILLSVGAEKLCKCTNDDGHEVDCETGNLIDSEE